jgi:hypothetical protein
MESNAASARSASYSAISRIAFFAQWTSVLGVATVAGSVVYLWLDKGRLLLHLKRELPDIIVTPPTEAMLFLAGAVGALPALLVVLALWQAKGLFGLYREGRIFAPEIPAILMRLGHLAVGAALASIVTRTLVILFLTLENPPGARHVVLGFGSTEVLGLVASFLLFSFSLVARESRRIADENESFI